MSDTFTNGRQALITKYLGPTNSRGSRVKASCEAISITVSWDHALSAPANHEKAAQALVEKCKLQGGSPWVGSALPDGRGYAFVAQGQWELARKYASKRLPAKVQS